jgi:hypothetical protein
VPHLVLLLTLYNIPEANTEILSILLFIASDKRSGIALLSSEFSTFTYYFVIDIKLLIFKKSFNCYFKKKHAFIVD